MHAYADSSWADDNKTRRSTTGTLIFIDNHLVDWSSKLQSIVTHSTAEAEYIAANAATRTVMWFRSLMLGLDEKQDAATIIYEDNMACVSEDNMPCVSLSKGEGRYLTSKNIGIRYSYLKEK